MRAARSVEVVVSQSLLRLVIHGSNPIVGSFYFLTAVGFRNARLKKRGREWHIKNMCIKFRK